MKIQKHYDNVVERQTIIAEWESKGYEMLHDDYDPGWKQGDTLHGTLTFSNEPNPPVIPAVEDLPKSQHLARIKSIDVTKPKPITVTRTYQGIDFDIPCIVTQDIKDQFVAGKIAIGDIVIVAYCEERYEQAIIQSKVFKSW